MNAEPTVSGNVHDRNRQLILVVYILYAVGLFNGVTTVIGAFICYLKKGDMPHSIWLSHANYLIKTFWWTLLWGIIGSFALFVFVGYLILTAVTLWYIYRIVKGFLAFSDRMPMQGFET